MVRLSVAACFAGYSAGEPRPGGLGVQTTFWCWVTNDMLVRGMARRLPPLNPLRAFEAAGRLGSFTLAAAEMGVSPVAVGRQVRVLEQHFRVALFHRRHRAIALTRAGQGLLDSATEALDLIAAAGRRLSGSERDNLLTIQSYTTFSQRWLIPRLPIFQREFPAITLRLTSATGPVDFASGEIDAAIRSGPADYPGMEADRLATIALLPVCTPAFKECHRLTRPRDLARCTLLYSLVRQDDWAAWLRANRCGALRAAHQLSFESSALAYEAALRGLGVAMGIGVLVEQNLRDGLLVAPFPGSHVLTDAYYLVRPRDRPASPALRKFRDWVRTQLDAGRGG